MATIKEFVVHSNNKKELIELQQLAIKQGWIDDEEWNKVHIDEKYCYLFFNKFNLISFFSHDCSPAKLYDLQSQKEKIYNLIGIKSKHIKHIKFTINQKVRIRKDSKYYGIDNSNPKDIEGKIIRIYDYDSDVLNINVLWDNKKENVYNESDLELIELTNMKKYKVLRNFGEHIKGNLIELDSAFYSIQWKTDFITYSATIPDLIKNGYIKPDTNYEKGDWVYMENGLRSTLGTLKGIYKYEESDSEGHTSCSLGILYFDDFDKLSTYEEYCPHFSELEYIKRLATKEEILRAFTEIAKSKGYVRGVKITSPYSGNNYIINGEFKFFRSFSRKEQDYLQGTELGSYYSPYIYYNGKWATIVEESKHLELAGHEVIFNDNNTVSVGCKKDISKEYFASMLKVQKFCSEYDVDLTFSETGDISTQKNKYLIQDQIKQINERLK